MHARNLATKRAGSARGLSIGAAWTMALIPVLILGLLGPGIVAAEEPTFENVHVLELPKRTYGYRSLPGDILHLGGEKLLLTYTGMTPEGKENGTIAGKISEDLGKTWGEEFVLAPKVKGEDRERYCLPSTLRLDSGDILLSYIYASSTKPLYGHTYYRRSTDNGETWGEQLIVTPHPGYNLVHNDKLLQLENGRIIAAAEYEFSNPENDHGGYVSYTVYSDDNGFSWHRSENVVNELPIEAQEPHVVELKDGRLLMLMRTYSQYVLEAYSDDKGETWSDGEKVPELTLPRYTSSAINLDRIPKTGDLIMLRCNDGPKEPARWRTPFVSILSKDEGESWTNQRAMFDDPEEDYGYPSLTFVDDLALISYHRRDGLHVARIGVDWFYGGE